MDEEDGARGFTPRNALGCAMGGTVFVLVFGMLGIAFGTGCQPEMPCWTDNGSDIAVAFAAASALGVGSAWATARVLKWIAKHWKD